MAISKRVSKSSLQPGASGNVVYLKTDDLKFDPENPRFYRLETTDDVEKVIDEMVDKEGVRDLMVSIGQKGYFSGEPLLVVTDNNAAPYIVVEGNRRLAAVKLLNGQIATPARRKQSILQIQQEAAEQEFPTELPCLIYKDRKEVLRYLGYRHITGIQEWDALSKAKYLLELKNTFYDDLSRAAQLKALANDIGSNPAYVGSLLTALAMYQKASDNKFFDLPISTNDVEFSYITTALGYRAIANWLGLEDKKDFDISEIVEENLKLTFGWFFSKDRMGKTILGESRNLTELAAIVQHPKAIAVLKETGKLSDAYLFTDGPSEALESALRQALAKVAVAWRMVPDISKMENPHGELAHEIFDHAKSLRNAITSKLEDE